ncbi:MAG: Maf family protein [Chitinivibrionia bacterium]|nr:Maf family protein [Chitinivibrionia bacterium]
MKNNNKNDVPLILASKSPRRKEILADLGLEFIVETADIGDESRFFENCDIENAIIRLARAKSERICEKYPQNPVLSADTVVVFNGKIFGKPVDRKDAQRMLKTLSGKSHFVYTAINLVCKEKNFDEVILDKTQVWFREIDENELQNYLDKANYADKAGGYGIQDEGKYFVEKINGDYWTVVGLGIVSAIRLLKKLDAQN